MAAPILRQREDHRVVVEPLEIGGSQQGLDRGQPAARLRLQRNDALQEGAACAAACTIVKSDTGLEGVTSQQRTACSDRPAASSPEMATEPGSTVMTNCPSASGLPDCTASLGMLSKIVSGALTL
eukprot:5617249-Prymnesium_polylepis.1